MSSMSFLHQRDSKYEMSSFSYFSFNLSPNNFANITANISVNNRIKDEGTFAIYLFTYLFTSCTF